MNPSLGRFHTMDPYEGNVFDPPSLHKYTYCHNNPVNFVDYLGLYSAAVIGTFIHQHIRDWLYPNENVLTGMIPNWTKRLFPDIADLDTKEVYEIKPLSPYGVATGHVQLAGYIVALNAVGILNAKIGTGWRPGKWVPPYGPHIEPKTKTEYIIVGNFAGVIFYWFPNRRIEKRVWEKVEQADFSLCRESEDIINAYILHSQLTVIELQAITENLVKVALAASVAYMIAYTAYVSFRMSLATLCFI